jgi:Type VI secretion, TssG
LLSPNPHKNTGMAIHKVLEKMLLNDARMEPLLAELLESRLINPDSLVIRSKSTFKRAYNRDITGIEVIQEKKGKTEETVAIEISRGGFYDSLPEFFFHEPEAPTVYKNIGQRVKESERVKDEEAQARKFFLPLEQEFFRKIIQIEQHELKLTSGFGNPVQQEIFERFWTDTGSIGAYSKAILFYLLPLVHQITGNQELMRLCFSAVLREDVEMRRASPAQNAFSGQCTPSLGGAALGANFIAGSAVLDELPGLEIIIGPIELRSVSEYLQGGEKQRLLAILCDYFVPVELDIVTHVELKKEETAFVLSEGPATAYLGFSTIL